MEGEEKKSVNRKDQEVRPIPGLHILGAILRLISFFSPVIAARFTLFLFSLPGRRAKHYKEDDLLQQANRRWVISEGIKIRTYQWGSGGRKIMLLHGWQSRGTALRYFVPSLVNDGFEVVAMDAPGHGESNGFRMTITDYACAIRNVDKEQGPFEGVIAHSFGARAITYAMGFIKHDWHIKKIVLLAVPASITGIFNEFFSKIGASKSLIKAAQDLAVKRLGHPVEDSEIYNMRDRIHAQLLIIHDDTDEIVPLREAKQIAAAFPASRFVITSGLGHYRLAKSNEIWEVVRTFFNQQ